MALAPGTRLGSYEVTALIGEGGSPLLCELRPAFGSRIRLRSTDRQQGFCLKDSEVNTLGLMCHDPDPEGSANSQNLGWLVPHGNSR